MISENSRKVFKFLQANPEVKMTAADIAEELGLGVKVVNGCFTQSIQKKGYGVRVEAVQQIVDEDGEPKEKKVKLLTLTDEGKTVDIDTIGAKAEKEAE